MEFNTIWKHQ